MFAWKNVVKWIRTAQTKKSHYEDH